MPAGKRSNGAALGISSPPRHSASARRVAVCSISARLCMREDVAGTANGGASCATAMIWCKPLKPQHTRGRSLANTALERYAGRLGAHPFRNSAQQQVQFTQQSSTLQIAMLLPLAPKQRLRLGLETAGSCSCAFRLRCRSRPVPSGSRRDQTGRRA